MARVWSDWRPFPDPREGGILVAPFGAGCYDLRLRSTGEMILFGMSGHVANRLSTLLPKPLGCGTRNNAAKQNFIFDHLPDVDYRTIAATSRAQAADIERGLDRRIYRFIT